MKGLSLRSDLDLLFEFHIDRHWSRSLRKGHSQASLTAKCRHHSPCRRMLPTCWQYLVAQGGTQLGPSQALCLAGILTTSSMGLAGPPRLPGETAET